MMRFARSFKVSASLLSLSAVLASLTVMPISDAAQSKLKGGVSSSTTGASTLTTAQAVAKARSVFEAHTELFMNKDLNFMKFYSPKAKIIVQCQSPYGAKTLVVSPSQIKNFYNLTLKLQELAMVNPVVQSTFYAHEGNKVRIEAYYAISYASHRPEKDVMKLAPDSRGRWWIVEDHDIVKDPTGDLTKVLTAILDPSTVNLANERIGRVVAKIDEKILKRNKNNMNSNDNKDVDALLKELTNAKGSSGSSNEKGSKANLNRQNTEDTEPSSSEKAAPEKKAEETTSVKTEKKAEGENTEAKKS